MESIALVSRKIVFTYKRNKVVNHHGISTFAKIRRKEYKCPTVRQFVSEKVENSLDYKKRQLVKNLKKHLSEFGCFNGITTTKLFSRFKLSKSKFKLEEIESFRTLISETKISLLNSSTFQ